MTLSYGSVANPVRLDPWTRVIGVGWASKIAVLSFSLSLSAVDQAEVDAWDASLYGSSILENGSILEPIGVIGTPPNFPAGRPLMWCYEPLIENTSEIGEQTYTVVDRALYDVWVPSAGVLITEVINAFGNQEVPWVTDYTGNTDPEGDAPNIAPENIGAYALQIAAAYFGGEDPPPVGLPHLKQILVSHQVTGDTATYTKSGTALIFVNMGKAKAALRAADLPDNELEIKLSISGETFSESLSWSAEINTYAKLKQWPPDGTQTNLGIAVIESLDLPVGRIPPYQITFTINLTTGEVTEQHVPLA